MILSLHMSDSFISELTDDQARTARAVPITVAMGGIKMNKLTSLWNKNTNPYQDDDQPHAKANISANSIIRQEEIDSDSDPDDETYIDDGKEKKEIMT